MVKQSRSILFTLWLLLIPLPLFFPLFILDYTPYYDQFSSLSFYPNLVLALPIIFIGCLGTRWRAIRRTNIFKPLSLSIPLCLLVLLTAISIGFAAVDGRLAAIMLFRLTIALLLYFAIKSDWLTHEMVSTAMLIFLCVQGIAAGLQFWLQDDLGLQWLGELDLEPVPGGGSIIFGQDEYWLRGYGLAPHPNILGGLVGSALLIVLFGWDQTNSSFRRFITAIAIFLGTFGLAITFSRSAWLGTAVGLAAGFSLKLLRSIKLDGTLQLKIHLIQPLRLHTIQQLTPIVLAIALFIPLALPPLQARAQPQENQIVTQSIGERQILIEVAFDFIGDSFPIGIGAGNFGPAMLTHPERETFPNIHPVHNVPLLLTAELGLLGGAAWLWLMLFPAGYGLWSWWKGSLTPSMIGIIGALLVLATVDLFDYYSWGWPHGLTWRWMLFGLLAKKKPRNRG